MLGGDSLGSIYISLGYFYSNFNSNWRYIISRTVTLVLRFLNPLLYRNIPLSPASILERVVVGECAMKVFHDDNGYDDGIMTE